MKLTDNQRKNRLYFIKIWKTLIHQKTPPTEKKRSSQNKQKYLSAVYMMQDWVLAHVENATTRQQKHKQLR